MSRHYRLGLLLCDTPPPSVVAEHGAYHSIFNTLMKAAAPEDVTYELASYDVVREMAYPPTDTEFDAVLLTGSGEAHPLRTAKRG
jgi:hypothetical protein